MTFERSVVRSGPSRHRPRAFTLIELLVVVAIIGVLIGILMPALGAARRSAGLAQCLNNLRQITVGGTIYSKEQKDGMWPIVPTILNATNAAFDTWKYGGKTASAYWQNNRSYHPVGTRLINEYVHPDIRMVDPAEGRIELETFRCPNDIGTYQRSPPGLWYSNGEVYIPIDNTISAYDDVGTSYQLNIKWFIESTREAQAVGAYTRRMVWDRTRLMFRDGSLVAPSRFVWLHDQSLDLAALTGAKPDGDHGGRLRSTAAFLDGHVSYVNVTPDDRQTQGVAEGLETREYILKLPASPHFWSNRR